MALTAKGAFSLPINLLTINQFFGKTLNPSQAQEFIAGLGDHSIKEPHSFEEQALKMLGRDLYQAFFRGYTIKQWGVDPRDLPASILKRLPVRFSYNDQYYNCRYQGIPLQGYTDLIRKMLDHQNIEVRLEEGFSRALTSDFGHVFFSGPLDMYFDYQLGRLGYRTLDFERSEHEGDFQGCPVLNYCNEKVLHTRVTEHKHFTPWNSYERTIIYHEYSRPAEMENVRFYPLRLAEDTKLFSSYLELVNEEPEVTFVGRLGTYRYLDMDAVVGEALDISEALIQRQGKVVKVMKPAA